ncbi:hypothetical protein [Streptomyces sp. NPDC058612]|uniref:hypothetical protein n=1 Tax=Streptomyces sp. NPDC058612 TaxID=3346555 RepID=UPI00364ED0AF
MPRHRGDQNLPEGENPIMDTLSAAAEIASLIAAIATITLEIYRARIAARAKTDTNENGPEDDH